MKHLLNFLLILLTSLSGFNCRKLSVNVNPDCPGDCSGYNNSAVNLVHIQSKGDEDIIHYLWSSITCIPPTLLIAETKLNSNLTINWSQLLDTVCDQTKDVNKAISLTNVTNSLGFQFSRLFFFNDINKTGSYQTNDSTLEIDWKELIWEKIEPISKVGDSVTLSFKTSNESKLALQNGSLAFDLRVDASDGRQQDLPHLAFTQKSVSLQMSLNKVNTSDFFNISEADTKARVMADIYVMTGGAKPSKDPKFDIITSIDDEYTPGVFRRIVLDLKNGEKEAKNSFLSWKPIGYNAEKRIIANTMDVIHGDIQLLDRNQLIKTNSRIFEAFFDVNKSCPYVFNLTFGAPDDPIYYTKNTEVDNKYNSFSLVVGVDSAPDEGLSILVKIIIVAGFGLPLIVMIISAMYLIVRKIRKRNSTELLLNQSAHILDDSQH